MLKRSKDSSKKSELRSKSNRFLSDILEKDASGHPFFIEILVKGEGHHRLKLASMTEAPEQRPRIRAALAVIDQGKVLLVEHTKSDRKYWLLPGGGLEWGESLHAACVREVKEETGFDVEAGELIWTSETLSPCGKKHLVHMVFSGKLLGGQLQIPNNEERITDVRWVPLNQVTELVLHPPMEQALARLNPETLERHPGDPVFLGNLWVD